MKEKFKKTAKIVLPILAIIFGLSICPSMLNSSSTLLSNGGTDESNSLSSQKTATNLSDDSGLESSVSRNCYFGYKKLNASAIIGTKKSVTFTLKPDNVSDKNIIVKSSDPSKVSVSAEKIKSGTPINLCLLSKFSDTVTITAYSEVRHDAKCTILVNVVQLDDNYSKGLTITWDDSSKSYQVGEKFNGVEKDIIIPKFYDDNLGHGAAAVTSIAGHIFQNSSTLLSVVIPDTVTTIGEFAFSDCFALSSVNIPRFVASIGKGSFCLCSVMKSITVDSSNPYFTSMDGVLFTKDMKHLLAYPGGKNINYKIPDGVVSIADVAFYRTSVISVFMPDSVTSIGEEVFEECRSLTSVTFSKSLSTIPCEAFDECTSLASLTIPDTISVIDNYAFSDCVSLTSVTIPYSVTSIGYGIFGLCDKLQNIFVDSGNRNYCSSSGVLFTKDMKTLVGFPCGRKTSYEIPNGVVEIYHDAFDVAMLTSVTIPDTVKAIDSQAFRFCRNLTSITIPNSVTSIGSEAFYGDNIPSITIPYSVTTIDAGAFCADYGYKCTIYCQRAESTKPSGWATGWDNGVGSVVWK